MKKLLVAFAALIAMSISITASALTDGDWEYKLLDNEVIITGYVGEGGDVVIPGMISDRPVTAITGERMFRKADVTSLVIPAGIKEMGNSVFSDMKNLEKVTFKDGIEKIGFGAFAGCKKLEEVILPSTLKEIDDSAFRSCESLNTINIPDGLTAIGGHAFSSCGLVELDLKNVSTLGEISFAYCEKLKSVKIGYGTEKISANAFLKCTSLTDVDIPDSVTVIDHSFEGCTALSSIILPTSLKELGWASFKDCDSLLEVVVPYGTEKIAAEAFGNCDKLQAVYVPDTVTTMYAAFSGSPNCVAYCNSGSAAEEACKKYEVSYLTDISVNSLITVYYNGIRVSFNDYNQNPEIISDRTLVPLRAIFEAMNAEVEWDQATKTVTAKRSDITVKLTIGENNMYKNGKAVAVDVPAQIINDRTMIPVRVIAEAFGANVEWNGNGRAVLVSE